MLGPESDNRLALSRTIDGMAGSNGDIHPVLMAAIDFIEEDDLIPVANDEIDGLVVL